MKINWAKVITYPIAFVFLVAAIITAYQFFDTYYISDGGQKLYLIVWIGLDVLFAWGLLKIGGEW